MVQGAFTILIADRNPRVRGFLKREFLGEGYRVLLAKNGREVIKQVYRPEPLDLLVLDLDLPDTSGSDLLDLLQDRIPSLPVVLHCFAAEDGSHGEELQRANAFVEKQGNSVDRLKIVVKGLLVPGRKTPPETPRRGAGTSPEG